VNGSDRNKVDKRAQYVGIDQEAQILQANFEHYYQMAIDHYTKAGATSHILLVIVGALLVLIGYDEEISCSRIDVISAILVMFIGAFGAVWAGRQMERYRYWQYIALKYQEKMEKIVPDFERKGEYETKAKEDSKKAFTKPFGSFFSWVGDPYLWVILNLFIVGMGGVLLYFALTPICESQSLCN
jgi:hypothetical protein